MSCPHARFQVVQTGIRSYPAQWEPDGILLITEPGSNYYLAQVEIICNDCGEQRILDNDEWEVA